jgi:hypothetical protein
MISSPAQRMWVVLVILIAAGLAIAACRSPYPIETHPSPHERIRALQWHLREMQEANEISTPARHDRSGEGNETGH